MYDTISPVGIIILNSLRSSNTYTCTAMMRSHDANRGDNGFIKTYLEIAFTILCNIIGVSLSEPHTNQYYTKTAVLCIYVHMYM
jgi:hypothetical protein